MSRKRPQPVIEVRFASSSVYPESIPVRSLADALGYVYRLGRQEEEREDTDTPIRLLKVKRGSAVFQCVADRADELVERLRLVGRWLHQNQELEQLEHAFDPLQRLSKIASTLKCPIEIRHPVDCREPLVRVLPETSSTVSALLVTGPKDLQGRVERVGGATEPKCALRVPNQSRLVYCQVANEDLIQTLGQFLYRDVVVSGKATWLRHSWRIVSFDIHEVLQPKNGPLMEALQALRKAGGDAWDAIPDPQKYLEEISGRG